VGDVIPDDLDLVDGRRRAFANRPSQIHHRLADRAGPAEFFRLHLGVDVAVIRVKVLYLLGGFVPLRSAEWPGFAERGAVGSNGAEGVERHQLFG
jgi:hypothetical protein